VENPVQENLICSFVHIFFGTTNTKKKHWTLAFRTRDRYNPGPTLGRHVFRGCQSRVVLSEDVVSASSFLRMNPQD
jgi:hypothetical protein